MSLTEVPGIEPSKVANFLSYLNDHVEGGVQIRPLTIDDRLFPHLTTVNISEVIAGSNTIGVLVQEPNSHGGTTLRYSGVIPNYSHRGGEMVGLEFTQGPPYGAHRGDVHPIPFP